jgi:Zn-dependent metalloprotease
VRPPRSKTSRLLWAFALTALFATFATSLFAAQKSEIDVTNKLAPVAGPVNNLKRLQDDRALRALGKVGEVDTRFGVPTFVWSSRTAPLAAPSLVKGNASELAARDHLNALAALYHLNRADIASAQVRYIKDTGRGGIVVAFHQSIDGIDVFRDEVKVLMDRNKNLIATSGFIASRGDLA